MRREQVLKVCANHTICQSMELKPMNTSNQGLVWTATDFFRKTFCECQSRMSQSEASALSSCQMSRVQENSREANPQVSVSPVCYCIAPGTVTIELFSTTSSPRQLKTSEHCVQDRKASGCAPLSSTGSYRTLCVRVETSPTRMGREGNPSTGTSLRMRIFDVRHTGPGCCPWTTVAETPTTPSSFITLKKAEHLDFIHVAFGFVREGMDVVRSMGQLGTKTGKPSKKIVITECGQL
ncbi:hypothetical protein J4Q44_G00147400 [Coregonus suidteri]|uniref:Uncharacterized protein n=1 Tax=Coregonus suidteri TaxID=861788 RepID=A0AAN8MA08_9TELE